VYKEDMALIRVAFIVFASVEDEEDRDTRLNNVLVSEMIASRAFVASIKLGYDNMK